MSQPKKFTFERRFGDRRASPFTIEEKEPVVTLSQHAAALAGAASEAHARGLDEGRGAARAEEAARLARALEAVAAECRQLGGALARIEAAAIDEAVRFAGLFAQKLAGGLIAKCPLDSMTDAARTVLQDLRGAPHIAIRVAPELVEAAHARLSGLMRERGLDGKLVVLGDPETSPGDIRLEWADGGLVRDFTAASARIGAAAAQLTAELN